MTGLRELPVENPAISSIVYANLDQASSRSLVYQVIKL